jgi:hypothetical protein
MQKPSPEKRVFLFSARRVVKNIKEHRHRYVTEYFSNVTRQRVKKRSLSFPLKRPLLPLENKTDNEQQ